MGAREGVERARMQKWVQQSDNSLGKVPKKWGCHLWSGIDWKRWELGEIPARPLLCAKTKQKKMGRGKKRKPFPKMDFPLGASISVGTYLSIPYLAMAHGLESTGK